VADIILQTEDLNSYYGQSQILNNINFSLEKGKTVIMLGRNGMGKTTLIRSIMNLTPPENDGTIVFKDNDISKKSSYNIAKMGIGFIPQGRRLFSSLTVNEHLDMAYNKKNNQEWDPDKVYELFPEIAKRKKNRGTDLSGGEQQMLAIGRTLVTNPDLLLLDEPLEGLAPVVAEKVIKTLKTLKEKGMTMLWVEQKAKFIEEVADYVFLMEKGEIVYQNDVQNFIGNQKIKQEYLGV